MKVMKKVMMAAYALLFASLVATAQTRGISNLIGKWEAVDENDKNGGLEVIDSTKIFLVYGADKIPVISYKADFTKTPGWFDFTIKDSTKETSLKSLLQFVNEDTIQWQVFDGETRPLLFSADRGEMVYLKRKK